MVSPNVVLTFQVLMGPKKAAAGGAKGGKDSGKDGGDKKEAKGGNAVNVRVSVSAYVDKKNSHKHLFLRCMFSIHINGPFSGPLQAIAKLHKSLIDSFYHSVLSSTR